MKNNVITIAITLAIVLIVVFAGIFIRNNILKTSGKANDELLRVAIFPSGGLDESYYFVLKNDSTLECSLGTRKNDKIDTQKFLNEVSNKSEIVLTEQEFQRLIDLANEVSVSNEIYYKETVFDAWDATILYKNQVYEICYWGNENEFIKMKELVKEVIRLSSIPVNLHGWA